MACLVSPSAGATLSPGEEHEARSSMWFTYFNKGILSDTKLLYYMLLEVHASINK